MSFRQKRRATSVEIATVCFIKNLSVDDVAEAWVDSDGNVDVVLNGFIDRLTVNIDVLLPETT